MEPSKYQCKICDKQFFRQDNLKAHELKHDLYQCVNCPQAFTTQVHLESHRNHHHGQIGGSAKRKSSDDDNGLVTKRRITKYDNPKDNYTISFIGEQKMNKFNTTSKQYRINFNGLDIQSLQNVLQSLYRIFKSIIHDLTEFMDSRDLVRLSVQCPELDYPISLPFKKLSELSAELLLTEIQRVLQSNENFVIDKSLEIEVMHVRLPSGSGHKRKPYVDLERTMQEKRCFIKINNRDELCCARAIVTAKAKLDKDPKWDSIRMGRGIQKTLAMALHKEAGIPLRKCNLEDVRAFQSVLPGYQIHILSKEAFNAIVYKGPEAEKKLYIYLHDDHYDVISTMTGFLGRSYYCTTCNKGYSNKDLHACNEPCHLCHKCHDDQTINWKYCQECNRHFRNKTCYDLHAQLTIKGNSTCKTYHRCLICSYTINKDIRVRDHVCGEQYCNTCKDYKSQDHKCYMKTVAEEDELKLSKRKTTQAKDELNSWIFFDFECTQDDMIECDKGYVPHKQIKCSNCHKRNCHINPCEKGFLPKTVTSCFNCKQISCGTYKHVPNLCIAHKVCEECMDETKIDELSFCSCCQYNQRVFSGPNTKNDFCKWLFSKENKGSKVFCHNFKGYDSYFIVSYLYENNDKLPEVIMNGSKFMSIDIPQLKMRFLDSMNFMPMALSRIPKAFGLTELEKGVFPHLYNRKENQHAKLKSLPELHFYNPDGMLPEDRSKFLKWYECHKNDHFDFQKELLEYCRSDVDVLRRGCMAFRDIFMGITSNEMDEGIDPFKNCITIASACNLVFRKLFLDEETLGIIPPQGYNPEHRQSVKAMQWIKYMAHQHGLNIQHSDNGGEKQIGHYRVDGYYETNGRKTVLEFHGDFWHGNPKCYSSNTLNSKVGLTMGDLYQRTLDKKNFIEDQGFTYIEMWESDFDQAVKSSEEMKIFIDNIEIVPPLEPRDAFFGGRTEAFKLHSSSSTDTKLKYYDVTSLYPFINKTGKIPLGHPTIITEHFTNVSNYEGIIKCRILPPRDLYIPVLPTKANGKLLFGLCMTCMKEKQKEPCQHSDRERMMTGTWVTDEVKKAIEKGYIVDKIYEVWHFENISQYNPESKKGGAFTDYVNTFLKLKQESSGFPVWCITEEQKQTYIHDYYVKEGIRLCYENIKYNPGLRALAKLMLNSFWGKFGQRENMPKIAYITDPEIYFDMLTSDKQEIKDVSYVTEEMVRVQYVMENDFIESSGRTNVVIAAYTTAQARLKLYSYLEMLGKRTLYTDTDSIIFTVKEGEWEPPLGDYLGDMTDEVPGEDIVSFVTGGPKNYAYVARDKEGTISTHCKVKGITLNFKNAMDINFDTIQSMVKQETGTKVTVKNNFKIDRNIKTMNIITRTEEKDYKIVFDKRVLQADLSSTPYGM